MVIESWYRTPSLIHTVMRVSPGVLGSTFARP